jgi:hypothetical protein
MKAPHESAFNDLKRLGRYLRGRPRLVYEYWPQRFQKELAVFCDSDHAGCIITRRSTNYRPSNYVRTTLYQAFKQHPIHNFAFKWRKWILLDREGRSNRVVDTSPTIWLEPRNKAEGQVRFFSSKRSHTEQGLGQTRHVETWFLWVQGKVQRRVLELEKVGTNHNVQTCSQSHCPKQLPTSTWSQWTCEDHNAEGSRCKAASLRPMGKKILPPGLRGVIACDSFHCNLKHLVRCFTWPFTYGSRLCRKFGVTAGFELPKTPFKTWGDYYISRHAAHFFPTNTFSAGEIEKDWFFSKQCFVGKNLHLFKEKLRNFQT